ncbi:MAG: succinate--CoA ligase subunit alpha [Desulfovibrio sp.]|jgi:succinyl-CoA synthetase alpha subunit|nr:succinate--CoA ligase subunit alpha [Desulfovibrio sp.]
MKLFGIDYPLRGIVQGATGTVGRKQTKWMLEAGTNLVAGVTPGKEGQEVEGLPVYSRVRDAVDKLGANASVIFVPPAFVPDAAREAMDAGIRFIVIVTEFLPVRDTLEIRERAKLMGVTVIGPNCPGVFVPGHGKLGIMPASIFTPGTVGVVGRSATLSYEVVGNLTDAGFGQRAAVGIGGDPVACTGFVPVLQWFERDPGTGAVALIGEIGGYAEEQAAEFIKTMTKPVVGLIAGRFAPPGKRFGHAGAIIRAGSGGPEAKVRALEDAGVRIGISPAELPDMLRDALP